MAFQLRKSLLALDLLWHTKSVWISSSQIGEHGEGKRVIWVIARQHPGESMAEWFAEGLLERLTDPHDATSRALLDKAVFYVVPNMNPGGFEAPGL